MSQYYIHRQYMDKPKRCSFIRKIDNFNIIVEVNGTQRYSNVFYLYLMPNDLDRLHSDLINDSESIADWLSEFELEHDL